MTTLYGGHLLEIMMIYTCNALETNDKANSKEILTHLRTVAAKTDKAGGSQTWWSNNFVVENQLFDNRFMTLKFRSCRATLHLFYQHFVLSATVVSLPPYNGFHLYCKIILPLLIQISQVGYLQACVLHKSMLMLNWYLFYQLIMDYTIGFNTSLSSCIHMDFLMLIYSWDKASVTVYTTQR